MFGVSFALGAFFAGVVINGSDCSERLASLGLALGLLPGEGQSLILAGALLSITVNPLAFLLVDKVTHVSRGTAKPGGPKTVTDVTAAR